jgi:hypothetical protein
LYKKGSPRISIFTHYIYLFIYSSVQVDYNTMIGVTGETKLGSTVKQFFTAQRAANLLVYNHWRGLVGVLLYEHHMDIR